MNYIIEGDTLILENGKKVEFEYNIKGAVYIDGIIVVALDIPQDVILPENVFAVSSQGKVLWQIKPWGDYEKTTADYYVAVALLPTNQVVAVGYDGMAGTLNIKTGEIVSSKFTK